MRTAGRNRRDRQHCLAWSELPGCRRRRSGTRRTSTCRPQSNLASVGCFGPSPFFHQVKSNAPTVGALFQAGSSKRPSMRSGFDVCGILCDFLTSFAFSLAPAVVFFFGRGLGFFVDFFFGFGLGFGFSLEFFFGRGFGFRAFSMSRIARPADSRTFSSRSLVAAVMRPSSALSVGGFLIFRTRLASFSAE